MRLKNSMDFLCQLPFYAGLLCIAIFDISCKPKHVTKAKFAKDYDIIVSYLLW